jgi:hypothetical protein
VAKRQRENDKRRKAEDKRAKRAARKEPSLNEPPATAAGTDGDVIVAPSPSRDDPTRSA